MGLLDRWSLNRADDVALPLSVGEVGDVLRLPVDAQVSTVPGIRTVVYSHAAAGRRLLEVKVLTGWAAERTWSAVKASSKTAWVAPDVFGTEDGRFGVRKHGLVVTLQWADQGSLPPGHAQLVPLLLAAARRASRTVEGPWRAGLLGQWRSRNVSDPGTLPLSVELVGQVLGRPVSGRLKVLGAMTEVVYSDAGEGDKLLLVRVKRGRTAKVAWLGYSGFQRIAGTTSETYVTERDEYGARKDDVVVTLHMRHTRTVAPEQHQLVHLLETALANVTR
jgi:hypothetical protein